ncbi:MAG: nitroreductase family protein [Candidatus Cloacimonetes bacterium]|nr:nitroreductase family protein [Candidatus Cloacimonadota bacterium]
MSGLIFFRTTRLEEVSRFYLEEVGMSLWLDQGSCRIFKAGNLLLGFCKREESETEGIITIFFDTREEVDAMYDKFADTAENKPRYNPDYDIYHFFCRDPEGRVVEFQKFESRLNEYITASDNLISRRSIRTFTEQIPDIELLKRVFEICRYSPTSMNRQKYYYVVTDNHTKIKQLAKVRGNSTAPLAGAPYVVAVCCTPETKRIQQDADIAATYLLLAAHCQGLATCWITDMDRVEVKELLDIPLEDYVTCLTPLGFAAESKDLPVRRKIEEFIKFV